MSNNPTKAPQGKGPRNFNCPYYNECLDLAIDREWSGWSCQECRHKHTGERIPEALEVFPYYLLLAALFSPIPYYRYRADYKDRRFPASWRKKKPVDLPGGWSRHSGFGEWKAGG